MLFAERLKTSPFILSTSAPSTGLIYEFGLPVPHNATFVHLFTDQGRSALRELYSSYMLVAAAHDVPLLLFTPTWRSHREALAREGFNRPDDLRRVNAEAVDFLLSMRRELGVEDEVYIGASMGPRVDGYDPKDAPDATTAEAYSRDQVEILASSGADLLIADTFSSAEELLGVSRAMAATSLPYIVAPVITANGTLPDGTPMAEMVERIDAGTKRPPLQFSINCVHPADFAEATNDVNWPHPDRVSGLQGNASRLSLEQRDRLDAIDGDGPETFADLMVALHASGLKVVGGCCGTNHLHLHALARRLKQWHS